MKKAGLIIFFAVIWVCSGFIAHAQTSAVPMAAPGVTMPWTEDQLLAPAALAADLKDKDLKSPLIFNIGAVEDIKGVRHIGAVNTTGNLESFKHAIAGLSKTTEVVIYCGCCPFAKCPNIRPAFNELKKEGFTNIKVLDLPVNLKTNWIAYGYPLKGSK
ncbi:MAG: rhodanese-like domain-containing protein [Mucilaginibacter sp.]